MIGSIGNVYQLSLFSYAIDCCRSMKNNHFSLSTRLSFSKLVTYDSNVTHK